MTYEKFEECWEKYFGRYKKPEKKTTVDLVVIFFSELVGTCIVIFIGCMGCTLEKLGQHSNSDKNEQMLKILSEIESVQIKPAYKQATANFTAVISPVVSISFGLGSMIATQIFAHLSLAHFNPVLSFAAVILRHIEIWYVFIYWLAQILGSLLATVLMLGLTTDKQYTKDWCLTNVFGLNMIQAFFVEFLLSVILVLVYAAATDAKHQDHQETWSIRIGLVMTGLILAGSFQTTGCLNPVRNLAPAVYHLHFEGIYWIYYIAPLLAAPFGALLYRGVFRDRNNYTNEGYLFWDIIPGSKY